jgi:hypothetical protein
LERFDHACELDRESFLLSLAAMEYSGSTHGRFFRSFTTSVAEKWESGTSACPLIGRVLWSLFVSVILVSGCSHSSDSELREPGFVGNFAAEPPTFLSGPMGVLLTNGNGYSAHATVQNEALGGGPQGVTSGQLLCRGTKLLFAPASSEPKKKTRGGGFAFIWDVASGRGYVLSGALQAYAPVSTSVHATNVVRESQGSAVANASVQMNDGTIQNFQCSPGELAGVPGRISATGGPLPLVVSLSAVRAEVPAEDVFTPPDDFSKYSSPEAMADELAARQRNLRRKAPMEFEPMQQPMRH